MDEILTYFFEAYLHQDWRDDYSCSFDAVRAFKETESEQYRKGFVLSLKNLLQHNDLTQNTINQLGGNFKPETEGFLLVNDWIMQAIETMQD